MPIVVNTNSSATTASFNLSSANDALRKSLARLSSGKRIVSPADDAGGMAVAYKMASKLKRTEAVRSNVQNGTPSSIPRTSDFATTKSRPSGPIAT